LELVVADPTSLELSKPVEQGLELVVTDPTSLELPGIIRQKIS
jgi:hypothetical protein